MNRGRTKYEELREAGRNMTKDQASALAGQVRDETGWATEVRSLWGITSTIKVEGREVSDGYVVAAVRGRALVLIRDERHYARLLRGGLIERHGQIPVDEVG